MKFVATTVLAAILSSTVALAGLEEKRKQKGYEEKEIPAAVSKIKELCGAAVKVTVDWASFKSADALGNFAYALNHTTQALEEVCKDSTGKEAAKKTLTAVSITNVADANAVKVTFEKGTIALFYDFAQGGSGTVGYKKVQQAVEAGL